MQRTLVRDVSAIATAVGAVGVSFGAIAVSAGLPMWLVSSMSVLVFAGGAQFMAVGMLAAGNPFAAVLAGLLLNARHLPFGMALADSVFPGAGGSASPDGSASSSRSAGPAGPGGAAGEWWRRIVGSHLMVDESVAFALAQPDLSLRRRAYWLTGGALFAAWNVGTLLGMALGTVTGDPATLGLDAAFPAGLIALLLPSLRDRDTRRVALIGAAVAVLTTPLLPAGLPVLLALAGLGALLLPVARQRASRRRASEHQASEGRASERQASEGASEGRASERQASERQMEASC